MEIGSKERNELIAVNKKYKDTVFRMLFAEKSNLLELYNAINHSKYEDESALQVVTLENAVYLGYKNDVAFLLENYLNLYEHQSTYNPNMAIRDLFYVADEYQAIIDKKSLYTSKQVKIPTPRFLVFYNGEKNVEEKTIQKLSDHFEVEIAEPELELIVTMFNINVGHNLELMEQCRTLKEYAEYVACVRKYTKTEKLEEAVSMAVDECIQNGILEEFLRKQRAEVISVSIYEYDHEKEMEKLKKAEYAAGEEAGTEKGIEKVMELTKHLVDEGRYDDIKRAANDSEYRKKLFKEYGIN